jgi:hypothetical protein
MQNSEAEIMKEIVEQLSQLLNTEIFPGSTVPHQGGSSGTVRKVTVLDKDQNEKAFILKYQENDLAFPLYQYYLQPYHLNSPKEYGYIQVEGQRFLVLDYISHAPADWEDGGNYLVAVKWLIKKDLITSKNIDELRTLDCFGKMEYYGNEYWLPEFEEWFKNSPGNPLAEAVWRTMCANQNRIKETIRQLDEEGIQTVVHGDLQLSNILFTQGGADPELFVIDWTQPHISSVTKDLASLYDNAPGNVKNELVKTYQQQIDFTGFDEVFSKAKVLRDIGYLSWMAWMVNSGQKEEIAQSELNRVAASLVLSLTETR